MNQSLLDTIAAEVRDFMKTVSELEYICIVGVTTSRVKYKTVLHMLEDKLGISHDQLSSQKDQIKAIIKVFLSLSYKTQDETIKEFRERIEKNSKQDMASEFYPTEDYSGLIDRPVVDFGALNSRWNLENVSNGTMLMPPSTMRGILSFNHRIQVYIEDVVDHRYNATRSGKNHRNQLASIANRRQTAISQAK